jgi:hypothetical protein
VPVQGYVCRQPGIVSIVDGLVEGEVEGSVFEEESEVCVIDTWVLGEIGAIAWSAVDPSGIDLTIRTLPPQLPRDS